MGSFHINFVLFHILGYSKHSMRSKCLPFFPLSVFYHYQALNLNFRNSIQVRANREQSNGAILRKYSLETLKRLDETPNRFKALLNSEYYSR